MDHYYGAKDARAERGYLRAQEREAAREKADHYRELLTLARSLEGKILAHALVDNYSLENETTWIENMIEGLESVIEDCDRV